MLRPIRLSRATVTLTKVSGHHPTGADATSRKNPAAAAAATAAQSGIDHDGARCGVPRSGAAAGAGGGRVVGIGQVSFWCSRVR